MAKTESTAINNLIDQVQGKAPPPPPAGDDLFASMHPPRMTSTVPPMRGAGELPPLPRSRAPQATSEQSIKDAVSEAASDGMPRVRMRQASPARGTTIPPLSRLTGPAGTVPPPVRAASPSGQSPVVRTSTLPPPTRASRPSGPPQPPPGRASSQSMSPPPPPTRASSPSPDVEKLDVRAATLFGRPTAPPPFPELVQRVLDPALPPLTRKSAAAGTMAPPIRETPMQARATVPSGPIPTRTNLPPSAPIAAPFETRAYEDSPFAAKPLVAPMPAPMAASTAQPFSMPQEFPLITPPDVVDDHWYESRSSVQRIQSDREHTKALIKKLIAPALLVIAAGIVIGAVIATGRQKHATPQKPATPAQAVRPAAEEELVVRPSAPRAENDNAGTASAGAADPQPPTKAEQAEQMAAAAANGMTQEAPKAAVEALEQRVPGAPAVREVQTKNGVVKFVDVRIDSDPAGATVTLVDGGKQSFLGSTPLSTSVEASREYDVIVALDGRPTQMVHLDPATTSRLDVSLGRKSTAAVPASSASMPTSSSTPSPRRSKPAAPAAATTPMADVVEGQAGGATEAAAKTGTLMVSSKPPCEIIIDGEATGLTTPQRSIELPAGSHEITFKNDSAGISKTVSVKITGGQATKLIQNLMTE